MGTLIAVKLGIFVAGTMILLYFSSPSLRGQKSHGFYRFFAWETILAFTLLNLEHWFINPFSPFQIISWLCLALSIFLVIHSIRLLRFIGKPDRSRQDSSLLGMEKTTSLVTAGAYQYIRHPLYSSLLFLTAGIFLKSPTLTGVILAVVAIFFLTMTAKAEEDENVAYFGLPYREYMKHTKMFIPFVF